FPETTIAQARERAGSINSKLDAGVNPNELRRERRSELMLDDLFALYMDRHAKPNNKRPENAESSYRLYLSQWGRRSLSTINRNEIQSLHAKLGRNKGKVTANIAIKLLSSLYNRAIDWGVFVGENPAKAIKKFREKSRDRFLNPDELGDFLTALKEEPEEDFRDLVLMLLLTGARRGNVQAMRWQDIDFKRKAWNIPETKTGESHLLPLSPQVMAILARRQESRSTDYVFPGRGKTGHIVEPKKAWGRLLSRAKINDFRLHDLRRTHGSWLAATGANISVIGKALGHKHISTTAIYARLDVDPVRQATEKATAAMMAGYGDLASTNVIQIDVEARREKKERK
ncbi:MAG: site-specific integrase, partial [Gammaproteobacteria bacterium]|nr:site-specific integrase [Gammaproteobacteria bacterium]